MKTTKEICINCGKEFDCCDPYDLFGERNPVCTTCFLNGFINRLEGNRINREITM